MKKLFSILLSFILLLSLSTVSALTWNLPASNGKVYNFEENTLDISTTLTNPTNCTFWFDNYVSTNFLIGTNQTNNLTNVLFIYVPNDGGVGSSTKISSYLKNKQLCARCINGTGDQTSVNESDCSTNLKFLGYEPSDSAKILINQGNTFLVGIKLYITIFILLFALTAGIYIVNKWR